MAFSGPFLLYYLPFFVAITVLIWANISRRNIKDADKQKNPHDQDTTMR